MVRYILVRCIKRDTSGRTVRSPARRRRTSVGTGLGFSMDRGMPWTEDGAQERSPSPPPEDVYAHPDSGIESGNARRASVVLMGV